MDGMRNWKGGFTKVVMGGTGVNGLTLAALYLTVRL